VDIEFELNVRSCELCGAVTGINESNNWDKHAAWHRRIDKYIENLHLAACDETQRRLFRMMEETPGD
jgi:hypothetical protein